MLELKYDPKTISVKSTIVDEGIKEYEIKPLKDSNKIQIEFSVPAVNIVNTWHPVKGFNSALKADWARGCTSTIAQSAPVETFYDAKGNNRLTVAWDELINKVVMSSGIHEEDGSLILNMTINKISNDIVRMLIIEKTDPITNVLERVAQWWEQKITPFPVNESQRLPMYSTWYAFHQNVTDEGLRKEVPYIKELGMDTIIIDDGWQTDDTNRGYAYCGDWQVAESKFPDFKEFVKSMHDEEIKIMVWFSVPFVGIKSNKWTQVKDKLLTYSESLEAGIIDIRYQENIDFIVATYKDFIHRYSIDGLKLDFIDQFIEREESPEYHSGMDYETVEEALEVLMDRVKEICLEYNPEFFIEFRQRYVGPKMREYSNAFRVTDCPYSAISNRVGIADLRILSGTTPVHSDMLLWHKTEKTENIGLQLAASLFSVIQFSVKLSEQTKEQSETLKFYTNFVKEHVELLQLSTLSVTEPENLYTTMRAVSDTQEIVALYSEQQVVNISKAESWIVNGNAQSSLYIKNTNCQLMNVEIFDATGKIRKTLSITEGLVEIEQFVGGITKIVSK